MSILFLVLLVTALVSVLGTLMLSKSETGNKKDELVSIQKLMDDSGIDKDKSKEIVKQYGNKYEDDIIAKVLMDLSYSEVELSTLEVAKNPEEYEENKGKKDTVSIYTIQYTRSGEPFNMKLYVLKDTNKLIKVTL